MKIYLVGGAVRDKLLNLDVKDLDYVVVGATPDDLMKAGYEQVGADFPVFLHPETKDEYALARTERKSGNGYQGFDCVFDQSVTLEDDLGRRDLTINSMAMDENGKVYDPYNGQEDLKNKVLRHTTDAFKEDPVRILRICRFSARYPEFTIHEDTKTLMKEMINNGEIDHLTKERVWKELEKTFTELTPSRFFENLQEVGGLNKILPEISSMIGVPQRDDYHAEGDVFIHTMMVMDEAAKLCADFNDKEKVEIVASALLHDVGKAKTPHDLLYNEDGSIRGNHHGHDDEDLVNPILKDIKERMKVPNNVMQLAKDVALMHQKVHRINEMSAKGVVRTFNNASFKNKGGLDYVNKIMVACYADSLGRKVKIDNKIQDAPKDYKQKDMFVEFYKAYESVSVGLWVKEYKEKNEKPPRTDLIKQELHKLRLNKIKEVEKKYGKKKKSNSNKLR